MKHLFIILFTLFSISSRAGNEALSNDSTSADTLRFNTRTEQFFKKRWVQSTFMGAPLIAAGFIEKAHNSHFRSLRNSFLPKFENHTDDYLQYTPLAITLGLKALGVESRNSWGKMVTANAFSLGLMAAATRGIKIFASEQRPDGSDNYSFPSGHTATAFACATILSKEYGHISPWISFGAYSMATATGMMRMMNNRHWMSDVLAGAGIGIMSTEFGYWLADIVFPKSTKNYNPNTVLLINNDRNPSFLGTFAGFYVPIKNFKINTGKNLLVSSNGATCGIEGAWFLSRHWGIGGQVSVSNVSYIFEGNKRIEDRSHFYSTKIGGYFSQHIYERLFFGAKILGGYTYYPNDKNNICENNKRGGFGALAGLSLGVRAKQCCDLKIGIDYEMFPSPSKEVSNSKVLLFTGQASIHF